MTAQLVFSLFTFLIFPVTFFNFLLSKVDFFNIKPFVVVSGSMEPEIPTGSLIYVVKEGSYVVGDILTFKVDNEYVSHRLIDTVILGNQLYYSTKGDANTLEDDFLVLPQEVVGKVRANFPVMGSITIFYKSSLGFWVGILAPICMMLFLLRFPKTYSR